MRSVLLLLAVLGLCALVLLTQDGGDSDEPARWWKGNTHSHTLWSDGDGAPEQVVQWYKEHGYHFLVLSDHNLLSEGERWVPINDNPDSRLTEERVRELVRRFGAEAVQIRGEEGARQMRLRTLAELEQRFEEPASFLLIQGEELTDRFEDKEVHVGGLNLAEPIPPQGGETLVATLNANVDAVVAQGRRLGRPVLAHINHPNFMWSLTWRDVAAVTGDRFFEVYNGHPYVNNYGEEGRTSTEELWDRALTLRLTELDLGLLYGVATDDAHGYWSFGVGKVNPGRGWVMVKAKGLEAGAIIEAMHRGDFYASSGVTLRDVTSDGERLVVSIEAEPELTYATRFIGTRLEAVGAVGAVLAETTENPAEYAFHGDELYVRAVVTSSRDHPNPYAEGDKETAWVQPVRPRSED